MCIKKSKWRNANIQTAFKIKITEAKHKWPKNTNMDKNKTQVGSKKKTATAEYTSKTTIKNNTQNGNQKNIQAHNRCNKKKTTPTN